MFASGTRHACTSLIFRSILEVYMGKYRNGTHGNYHWHCCYVHLWLVKERVVNLSNLGERCCCVSELLCSHSATAETLYIVPVSACV